MRMNYKFFIACVLTLALIIVGISRISTSNLSERKYSGNSGQITTICEYLNGEQFKTYDIVRLDIFDSLTKINCSKKDDSNFGRCGASFFVACILATRPKNVKCYFCAFYSV